MSEWLLLITLTSSGIAVPVSSWKVEGECRAALAMWRFEPGLDGKAGATGDCVPVRVNTVEKNIRRRR
jgi:hypothetical protein